MQRFSYVEMDIKFKHTPVLLQEVLEALNVREGKKYIDGTFGGGGHTGGIFEKGGIVLGIDQDLDAVSYGKKNFKFLISNFQLRLVQGNFRDIQKIAQENGFERVSGILFDLGFSSHQIEESGRGFSFLRDEPLDMRMSENESTTAKDIINTYTEDQLYEIFSKFGEERRARVVANHIIRRRSVEKITRSNELARIVSEIVPRIGSMHPATQVFQALRIAVNDELGVLKQGLTAGLSLLYENARFAVITFHSLEDRIVKNNFREWEKRGTGRVITKKPVGASSSEIQSNNRARSAKLRVFEKT